MKQFLFLTFLLLVAAHPVKNGYSVGDTASDFELRNTDGKMVSMASYKDAKGFIIVFDCNTCPVSKKYKDRIIALDKKYSPLRFQVIAINSNDEKESPGDSFSENVKEVKRNGFRHPYLADMTQEIARTYGATNTPHVYVLHRNGNALQVAYIGAIDDNPRDASAVTHKYVEEAVDALLAGKPVPTSQTKAIGCSIKWRES